MTEKRKYLIKYFVKSLEDPFQTKKRLTYKVGLLSHLRNIFLKFENDTTSGAHTNVRKPGRTDIYITICTN